MYIFKWYPLGTFQQSVYNLNEMGSVVILCWYREITNDRVKLYWNIYWVLVELDCIGLLSWEEMSTWVKRTLSMPELRTYCKLYYRVSATWAINLATIQCSPIILLYQSHVCCCLRLLKTRTSRLVYTVWCDCSSLSRQLAYCVNPQSWGGCCNCFYLCVCAVSVCELV